MPSIDKLRHNIRHAVSLSAFSPNLIHRIRYFFLCTVTFRDYSYYTESALKIKRTNDLNLRYFKNTANATNMHLFSIVNQRFFVHFYNIK